MRTRLVLLLAAALWAGCASTPATPPQPPGPPQPPPLRPLSPDAAVFFARVEAPGPGAAFVVNLDALESLGLLAKGNALRQLASLVTSLLPQLVALEDGPAAAPIARGAVAASVLRHWAEWPSAQRVGVLVSPRLFQGGASPQSKWNDGVLALAVEEGSPDNAKLLVGLAALGRSVTEELSREGAQVRMTLRGSDLCMEGAELEAPVCLRPRRGLLLLGTPAALDEVGAPTVAAASEVSTPVAPAANAPAAVPVLMGLRVDMGQPGRGSLTFTGRDAVRLALRVEGAQPRQLAMLDNVVKKFLGEYDALEVKKRERITTALAEVQAALAQDATAPAELKTAARALTVEQVVDEKGHWARMRQSVKSAATQDGYAFELTVPEGMVRDFAEQLQGGGAMAVSTVGVLAAIAIPNFIKFQARSKQSEAKVNLKSAFIGQRSFFAEKERWGRTFKEIGFQPEANRRYTYCMGNECLPCDAAGCQVAPEHSPCKGISKVGRKFADGFTLCAYGNVDNDSDWDVWVIDQDGQPEPLTSDVN